MKQESQYYNSIAEYFDKDAADFEYRYQQNPVLKRIRESFRKATEQHAFQKALEIGCGPGIDLHYFGGKYPDREIYGIDISPAMVKEASQKKSEYQLQNVQVKTGSVEDVRELFPGTKFDMVYVYFGALNTVFDLQKAARHLHNLCSTDATLVLTFVNRYYLMDIPLFLIRGRFNRAFERIINKWKGYSPDKTLQSRCYSARDIQKAFSKEFRFLEKRGYSIFYPAWYRHNMLNRLGENWCDKLWKLDRFISKTPFWNTGEYSLYVLSPKSKA